MAHINLLPWREERRQERQKQFFISLGIGFVFSCAILYSAIAYSDKLISIQNDRNSFLNNEIRLLDIKIKEISKLEQEKEKLLARMQVIQDLQESRPKVVKVFDSIVKTVPDGIHLDLVERLGDTLKISGKAQSNARVSVYMRNLDEDTEFNESRLEVIQRTVADVDRSFNLTVTETKPNKEGQ
jgi:type IV pilus assembly protein PilN